MDLRDKLGLKNRNNDKKPDRFTDSEHWELIKNPGTDLKIDDKTKPDKK